MSNPPLESHPAPGSFAPTSSKLQHDVVLEDLRRSLSKFPELKPLLRVLDPNVHEQPNEGHDAFASMFKSFCQQKHFEKQFKADVPDQMMKLIETYAATRPGADTHDHKSAVFSDPNVLANLASAHALSSGPVLKSKSVMSALSDLASHFNGTTAPREAPPETPLPPQPIPLPPSPQFHHFATQIFKKQKPFPDVMEGDGKPMNRVAGMEFENWGLTVKNTPSDTFVARTEVGLCNLVKWAGTQQPKKKIRVAGYRHTWSDLYSSENEVLVMLLPIKILTDIPAYEMTIQEAQKDSDLVGIEVADSPLGTSQNATSTLCTVKAGTTNEMFRRWCLDRRSWCLPFNVIMVEITFGGSNGPICHGSGFKTTTLSDLVAEFHYIDPSGNSKSISDPAQLRAASGCFGLLGICTAVTLRLEAITMAVMNPVKLPLALAIPPPRGFKIPSAIDMSGIDDEQLEQARKDFVKRCEEDDYLEWFWFPLTKKVWVNTWKKQDAASTASLEPYPSGFDALLQWTEGWLAEKTVTSWPFQLLSPRKQALLMGTIALSQMPDLPDPKDAIKTLFSEAIHFRRGIQNMRCLDSEWEIPIPESPNSPGKRDYQKVQQAWWDAIAAFYEREDVPMRLTLEMRLTGGSNVILAPQRGNNLGTISIEVLTTLNTPKDEWQSFLQQLVDKWTNYSDHKGERLMARPHWAKQWEGLMVDGQPIETYFKQTAYKQAIPEFRKALETIAQAQGTSVDAMRERFGNHVLEELFFVS